MSVKVINGLAQLIGSLQHKRLPFEMLGVNNTDTPIKYHPFPFGPQGCAPKFYWEGKRREGS